MLGAFAGDGVQVAFAHDQVVLALDLDLVLVLGVEEDAVADLDGPRVVPGAADLAPRAGDIRARVRASNNSTIVGF